MTSRINPLERPENFLPVSCMPYFVHIPVRAVFRWQFGDIAFGRIES
jgi:hypothetical protein